MANIINCKIGNYVSFCEGTNVYNSEVEDYSYINNYSLINHSKIGKFCSIGEEVRCGLGKHPTEKYVSTSFSFYSNTKPNAFTFSDKNYFAEYSAIEIGNDVWIGTRAMVLDGVKIGDGAIVAAGAVVTRNVAPFSIVGGVPAKLIKYRFDENTIKSLMEIKWWDMDQGWIRENFKEFHNTKNLLELIKSLRG
ncbi:MAG: CatB-related O-acetyltransferase [Methanococcaceae archaeon]